jgi:hypothetical protein
LIARCVVNFAPFLQENFFNVRPRDCNIDLVHIAIAADSLFDPRRTLTVLRTALIQLQNRLACDSTIYEPFRILKLLKYRIMEINRLTRTRDDACGLDQYFMQSVGPGKYTTTNLVPKAKEVNPLATGEYMLYPREGFGLNNAAIDSDSVLRNQPEFKSNRCLIRAQARPFLSVPYMGGGRGNADVETLLQHSEMVRQGKDCGTITEQQFDGVFTPMIPNLKENIQKPTNLITEDASPGWIRGGLPSRAYIRDVNC